MVRLADARTLVVKTADDAPDGMFATEAAGLEAISEALLTPAVIDAGPRWLVLDALDPCPDGPASQLMYCTARFAAPEAFFAAYDEVRPLAAGWRERMPILHLREQLSLVAHFGPQPETMAAIERTIKPFRARR